MAVKKLSVSLGTEVYERAKRAAAAEGVSLSTWLSQAAEEAAGLAEAHEALAEYIAVYGEPDPEDMAATRGRLDEAGVGAYETAEEKAIRMAALARLRGESPPEPQRRVG